MYGMEMKLCLSESYLVGNILKLKWTHHVTFEYVQSAHIKDSMNLKTRIYRWK